MLTDTPIRSVNSEMNLFKNVTVHYIAFNLWGLGCGWFWGGEAREAEKGAGWRHVIVEPYAIRDEADA